MKCSIVFSKKILFSHSVSSASIKSVFRAIQASSPILSSAESVPQTSPPALLSAGWRPIARKLFALRRRCVPEFRALLFAARQNASGNPEIRGLNRAPSWDRVLFAKSYRADARDVAARHHRAIRRARYLDRSGTSISPSVQKIMQSSILPRIIRCSEATEESAGGRVSSRGGGKKFVTLDTRSHTAATVVRLHAQHARVAADVDITGKRDLLRQCEDKFDRAAGVGSGGLDQEVEAAKAHVAGFPVFFRNAIAGCESHLQRKHHRETSRGAPLHNVVHCSSRRLAHLRQN